MQLKAQTRTHPSASQSGRSAAIPLGSRSQTTLPRHPLPRSAQHLRALGPARYCSQACARGSQACARGSSRSHACAQARHRSSPPRAPAPRPPRTSSRAQACALPRSCALARPLPRSGLRARAAAREGGAELTAPVPTARASQRRRSALRCAHPARPLRSHPRLYSPLGYCTPRLPGTPVRARPYSPSLAPGAGEQRRGAVRLLPLPGRASALRSGGRRRHSVQVGASQSHLQLQPSALHGFRVWGEFFPPPPWL
ncbi:hypothetical protein PVAP13_4NG112119 [Panicum virgatum]|uniref:Uncharacterized protein n=1 Tax=Panicum virgatum TaxID=38727 RepID=A0A8T0T2A5_PANVG|nr:hypothetical protein PVAP13_4NG112119 [Panicum virgatum]